MKRILVTGISGTGKSTVIAELAARGYNAVDADSDEYSQWVVTSSVRDPYGPPVEPGRDWVWRVDRMQALLSAEDAPALFVGGCAENMRLFLPQFDHIVLLRAPPAVIAQRLRTRTTNAYGKRPEEAERVLSQIETVEPLVRRIATHEIDTSCSVQEVAAALLRLDG